MNDSILAVDKPKRKIKNRKHKRIKLAGLRPVLPTEILIQRSLEVRHSVRIRVSVSVYDVYDPVGKYTSIHDATTYVELSNPGLLWKLVGNVRQGIKRMELEEETNDRPNEWFRILPQAGNRGRPLGSKDGTVQAGKIHHPREDDDVTDEGASVGPV